MTDPETRQSSPSPSPLQQAKRELVQQVEERLRRSGEDLRQLLDAFADAVPALQPPPPEPAAPPAPAPAADEAAALGGLRDSLAAIDGADSQSEVLSRLLEQATRYASRAALFLAGGDSDGAALLGWSATGFEKTGPSVEGLVLPIPQGSPWPAVLDGRGSLLLSAADCAPLCSRIETALPRRGALVPLVLRDTVEAVLYVDQEGDEPFSLEALQVLTHGAAQTLEIVPLRQRSGSPTLRLGDPTLVAPAPPPARPPAPEPAAPASEAAAVTEAPELALDEEEEREGPPTLSTAPITAIPDLASSFELPAAEVPAPAPAADEPAARLAEDTAGISAPAGLTPGERAAGFVLEPLDDDEPSTAPSEPAFELEAMDDLDLEDEGLSAEPLAPPPAAAPPPPAAPPAAPSAPTEAREESEEAAEDLFFEPAPAPSPPAPQAAPPEPPPPPSPPPAPAPPWKAPSDEGRDTQLISALSQPPSPAAPQPPAAPPASPPPPSEDAAPTAAVSSGGEVMPPADIEGPGWAFSGKPASPQAGTEPLHDEARRLARLLVSEIKLYNEELIAEGKRKGNIYQELREDIDRSRQMYEERIDEQVRATSDYFREELIRSLAGGDASVMGL